MAEFKDKNRILKATIKKNKEEIQNQLENKV